MALGIALAITAGAAAAARQESVPPQVQADISTLLATLGTSQCQFYRNGSWYDGHEAQSHLQMKYDYLAKRGGIHSVEEFIENAASRSSLSGEPYQVRCPHQEPVKSAKWLADQLRERRMVKQDRSG
jgi:hypothetical protein